MASSHERHVLEMQQLQQEARRRQLDAQMATLSQLGNTVSPLHSLLQGSGLSHCLREIPYTREETKDDKSLIQELQAETDEWLKDALNV